MNVNVSDSGTKDTDLVSFVACFDDHIIDLADREEIRVGDRHAHLYAAQVQQALGQCPAAAAMFFFEVTVALSPSLQSRMICGRMS